MSLSLFWPTPRPLLLAGRVYDVHPLRLRHLAALEAWAARQLQDTATALWDVASIPDPGERRTALRGLYERVEGTGPDTTGPDARAILSTRAGMAEHFRHTVRRGTRRPSPACALRIAEGITAAEWLAWQHVAWCVDDLDAIAEAIDREIGVVWPTPGPSEPGTGWGKSLWTVVTGVATGYGSVGATGWTLDQIGDLTIGQWHWLRSGGTQTGAGIASEAQPAGVGDEAFRQAVKLPRSRFWHTNGKGH
jgi:hypothetical protein